MSKSDEMMKFVATSEKLYDVLNAYNLIFVFKEREYPIELTIMPDPAVAAQLSMLETDTGISSDDARISFIFADGEITVRTSGRLYMSDALMSKVKGLGKKMHTYFLQAYFREHNQCVTEESPVPEANNQQSTELVPVADVVEDFFSEDEDHEIETV